MDITAPDTWATPPFPQDTALFIHMLSTGGGDEAAYRLIYYETVTRLTCHYPQAKILFVSSTSVYGQSSNETVTEKSTAIPSSSTSRILRLAEDHVLAHNGIVARLSGIYGPLRWALLKKFINGTATIDGDGTRLINQIHRDDAAAALLLLIETLLRKPQHLASPYIYNITDDAPTSIREFYTHLAEQLHRPMPPSAPPNPHRKRGLTSKRISNEKIRALGWKPHFPSFRDALPHILPTFLTAASEQELS